MRRITKTNKDLKRITQKIVREFHPEKIILFGSYAWGKPTKDSDVDLFIIKKKTLKRRIDRERELRRKLIGNKFPPMDLLVYTPDEVNKRIGINDFFIKDILQKGKILYEE